MQMLNCKSQVRSGKHVYDLLSTRPNTRTPATRCFRPKFTTHQDGVVPIATLHRRQRSVLSPVAVGEYRSFKALWDEFVLK